MAVRVRKGFSNLLRNDHGGIFPLFAMLIVPLVTIIALVIDASLAASAREQMMLVNQQTALAAISEYLANVDKTANAGTCGCTLDESGGCEGECRTCIAKCGVLKAVRRAQDIAGINFSIGESFRGGGIDEITDLATTSDGGASITAGNEGNIEFGVYYWNDCSAVPDPLHPCVAKPCGTAPCFDPRTPVDAENNAVRVTSTIGNSPLRSLFGKVVGNGEISITVDAIATLVPRNDYFLVDLSPSVYQQTYRDPGIRKSGGVGPCADDATWFFTRSCSEDHSHSEFVYELAAEPSGGSGCDAQPSAQDQLFINSVCSGAGSCNIAASNPAFFSNDLDWRDTWGIANERSDIPPADLTIYHHFRNEYRCREVPDLISDGGGGTTSFIGMFDYGCPVGAATSSNCPTTGEYFAISPPQPLFDILAAVHEGMNTVEDRQVATDKFGMWGFDDYFIADSPRHLPLASVEKGTAPGFIALRDATDLDYARNGTSAKDFISKGLFPLPNHYSDLFQALLKGMGEIATADNLTYKIAKNSIFLFSDGLSNCLWKLDGDTFVQDLQYKGGTANCHGSGAAIVAGIAALGNADLVNQLKDRKIAVSMALVGGGVGPHYLARKSLVNSSKCMDMVEARKLGDEQFVDTTMDFSGFFEKFPYSSATELQLNQAFAQSMGDPNAAFLASNSLYDSLVKPTGGIWAPILPVAPGNLDFHVALDAKCSTLNDTDTVANFDVNGVTVTDGRGRLLYDPFGRTPGQQLADAVKLSLASPYVLARSEEDD